MDKKEIKKSENNKYPLKQIYFYLTEGCNLRCRHCWIQPKYQTNDHTYPSLPFNLFRSIVEQAKPLGLASVKLTGGEPLLHPQIREILELIRTWDIRLGMETNGVLCTPEIALDIAACKNTFVSVSLDGSDAETHESIRGVKGCFESTLQGISNLVKAGLRPQVIMSLMRHNVDQIEAVVRLAESIGAGSVKFNIVSPIARGEKMHDIMEALTVDEYVEIGKKVEYTLSASTRMKLYFGHPSAFKPLGSMFKENGGNCGVCGIHGILGVLSDGSYALCGIGETVPDLVFGHAANDRLEYVWKNTAILNEIREGLPERLQGICKDCLMKECCRGHCIAQNYYGNKDLWAPYWYCEEARKTGIFPGTRTRPAPV